MDKLFCFDADAVFIRSLFITLKDIPQKSEVSSYSVQRKTGPIDDASDSEPGQTVS